MHPERRKGETAPRRNCRSFWPHVVALTVICVVRLEMITLTATQSKVVQLEKHTGVKVRHR